MEQNKKCKHCQSDINKKTKICTVCKKGQRNPILMGIGLAFICCFSAIFIAFILNSLNISLPENAINNNNKEVPKFSLSKETAGYSDGFAFYIEGGIRNNTNEQYSYVQVSFNLYDKDGIQIGTAIANINNMEANGIWKFKAIGLGGEADDVATYKLMEIIGY